MWILYSVIAAAAAVAAVWTFLSVGRCRRPKYDAFYGSLCAHRGLHSCGKDSACPENSIAAFKAAVDGGYGIELDVHLSADGVAVVFHDGNLKRMTGVDKKLSLCQAEELHRMKLVGGDECIPYFSEVLAIVAGRVPLVVELKCDPEEDPAPLCLEVSRMLDEYAAKYGKNYSIESFNPYVVKWFRINRRDVFRGQLSERFYTNGRKNKVSFIMEYLFVNVLGRPDFVAYNHKQCDVLSFRLWRGVYGAPCAYWTVRSEAELDEILARDRRGCYIFEGFTPSYDKIK